MEANFVRIEQKDGYQTKVYCYPTRQDSVAGSVLVLHGMAEHHGRYDEFARYLNTEGFDVYLYDHRGHGTDRKLEELGFFSAHNGSGLVVRDAVTVLSYVASVNRGKKLALFGHSMGSVIARNALQHYDKVNCAVICGTTMPEPLRTEFGRLIAGLACLLRGPKHVSKTIDHLMFGGNLYTRLCTRTSFDWLSRNNTNVGRYISDPYCGFVCTTSFYRDLILLTKNAAKKKEILKTRKDLPILLLAGDRDPVGTYGQEVRKLHATYEKLGFEDVSLKIYPEARHELLNETNRQEVMKDISDFLHAHMA